MDTLKVKHAERILSALKHPMMPSQVASATSIDNKTVQKSLNKLAKMGLIYKDASGLWRKNE